MKRAQVISRRRKGSDCKSHELYISNIEVLTESETNILENIQYRKRIDAVANELHVDWAVETSGNISEIVISKSMITPATDQDFHELEMKCVNFMKVVHDIIEEEKHKKLESVVNGKKTSHLEFCKELLKHFEPSDDGPHICGVVILEEVDYITGHFPAGQICKSLFKELLESYVKTHSHE